MRRDWRDTYGFELFVTIVLVAMLVLSPLALGAVAGWARAVLFATSAMLAAAWLLRAALRGELRLIRSSVWFFVVAFVGLVLIQLLPLSPATIRAIFPGTYEIYARTLSDYPSSGAARTLSLNPHATWEALIPLLTLALVFFVVMNTVHRRWQAVAIVMALIVLGSFEALYGFAEQFSGHKYIFWIPRRYHMAAVTGTFHNKNHFAGLLEMIVPVCFGLLLGMSRHGAGERSVQLGGSSLRVRFATLLSSSRLYQQLSLTALATVMLVAILFSLSRAGTLCALAGLAGFLVFLALAARFRGYTVLMLLIVVAILMISIGIGMELVVERMEEGLSSKSTSWISRVDLARSALPYIGDFPVPGSGFGTFGSVFPRYQSPRFGDLVVDFLHNDWLQLFCEMGFIGALVVIGGLLLFLGSVVRALLSRQDAFSRWVATGALLGACAMLLHSFFDYNLSKVTSNGVVFVTLLALSFVVAKMPGRQRDARNRLQYWRLPMRSVPVRATVALVAVVIFLAGSYWGASRVMADVRLNRYLTAIGRPDDYFFLPTGAGYDESPNSSRHAQVGTEKSGSLLSQAVKADSANPECLYWMAREAAKAADDLVRASAVKRARALLGKRVEQDDPRVFERVVAIVSTNLKNHMLSQRRPHLSEAEIFLRRAVEAAPTVARYHMRLARVLHELDPAASEAIEEAETALWLAPNKPGMLFGTGRILFLAAFQHGNAEKQGAYLDTVQGYFRRAILADPSYAGHIYPLVQAVRDYEMLLAVTPRTTPAYERLCGALWQAGEWQQVLECLDTLERLADKRTGDDSSIDVAPGIREREEVGFDETYRLEKGATGYEARSLLEIKLSVAQRRAGALSMLGMWDERKDAVARYRELLRVRLEVDMEEAGRLRRMGRSEEAMAIYMNVLQRDWANPEVLLAAAQVAALPNVAGHLPPWQRPVDHLYRLVINNDALSAETYERALDILETLPLSDPAELVAADFVRGASAVLSGSPAKGRELLESLSQRRDDEADQWRQEHLISYYLGLAYEQLGDQDGARKCFRKALEIVPTHRPALLRLSSLGVDVDNMLAEVTPPVLCDINFGGKLVLLGYGLSKEAAVSTGPDGTANVMENWYVTYYWQFTDRMHRSYHPVVEFLDRYHRRVARHELDFEWDDEEPYPVDFPRSGEALRVKVPLRLDPDATAYLRLRVRSLTPLDYLPRSLYLDTEETSYLIPIQR